MNVTALVCANGWTALYGPDGARVATYPPGAPTVVPHLVALPDVTVAVKEVPVNPAHKDFPAHL